MDIHGEAFLDEAQELLTALESALLELERNPTDTELVDQVFRALHTIKGSGAMFGFDQIAEFTHDIETVYDLVRDGDIPVTKELITLTLNARDQIQAMVDAVHGDTPPDEAALEELTAAFLVYIPQGKQGGGESDADLLQGEAQNLGERRKTYRIRFIPGSQIFFRGINPVGLLRELGLMGELSVIAQTNKVPSLSEIDPEACYLYWDLLLTTHEDYDTIRDVFIFVEDDCEIDIRIIDEEGWLDDSGQYKRLGEILVERGDITQDELTKALNSKKRLGESLLEDGLVDEGKLDAALAEQEKVMSLRKERRHAEYTSSIRVRSEKLDSLVNLVGELVTVQARLSRISEQREDGELQGVSEVVERLTWDLRDQILNIRMIPIGTTFSTFNRLVRDLSQELGKNVDLITRGAETELDKTVIERLNDPLIHLIRNCIDHGIEPPAERRKADKAEKGIVTLTAVHAGANVILQVKDDGRGLDYQAIRAKAVKQGLISADAELGDKDIAELIMTAGFSTASSVTNVSGRGVGMDVVKQAIEDLRGSVEVSGKKGQGTVFTIRLPLTLAIIDGLLVRIGEEFFVLPLSAVEECVEIKRAEAEVFNGRNLANVRGELVPFINLRKQFRLGDEVPDIEQVVIVSVDNRRVGFLVDHVIGEHQTVIKNLGKFYRDIKGLSGATILGDGTVALILDIQQLYKVALDTEQIQTESQLQLRPGAVPASEAQ
ncbi:MAG: chemotaxis protein CheA [Desulfuromonas sp.]|nr:MAG: chemotaxis protein CheA [Desulfuromonas sp.]